MDSSGSFYLSLDLGTTSLHGRFRASDGGVLAESRRSNPQQPFGMDVIRRLEAANAGEGRRLQALLLEGVSTLIADLEAQSGVARADIAAVAAAANPAICYLLRRLPGDELLFPPYRPRSGGEGGWFPELSAPLGLHPPLYLFPLLSGYVGGDLLAVLFGLPASSGKRLVIDVGTNAEMALLDGAGGIVTSVAAGPAFEGGGISCGMTAAAGAITAARVEADRLRLETINDAPPAGLCGSGLLSLVALALEHQLLDRHGTLVDPAEVATNLSRLLIEGEGARALVLYRDARTRLLLTQQDIRQFQLAKGAIRGGIDSLLKRARCSEAELEEVVLTGAFGHSLSAELLKKVAILPAGMVEKVRFLPAGVLAGIDRFHHASDGAGEVAALAARLKPYPLSGTRAFEEAYLRALDF